MKGDVNSMTIKLSDYILEQTISDASVDDIMIEQAVAEVEVASCLLEAYFKQVDMYGEGYFQEGKYEETRDREEEEAEAKAEFKAVQPGGSLRPGKTESVDVTPNRVTMKKPQEQSSYEQPIDGSTNESLPAGKTGDVDSQGNVDLTGKTMLKAIGERGVANFFKAVGNWFVKIWTKFMGWVTEKRMESILKKLDALGQDKLGNMRIELPDQLVAGIMSNDKKIPKAMSISTFEEGENFLNILTACKENGSNMTPEQINKLLDDVETFKVGLKTKLKEIRTNLKEKTKNYKATGSELRNFIKNELDSYRKNKNSIAELQKSLKQNKNIGDELAKKFALTDDKSGKRIYRAIKSIYDMYSTYMANQLRAELILLDPSKIKEAMKATGGSEPAKKKGAETSAAESTETKKEEEATEAAEEAESETPAEKTEET